MSFRERETLLDKVNHLAGDDEPDSDDLDVGKAVRKDIVDLDSYVDSIVDAGTEKSAMVDEQAEEHSSSTRAKRARFIAPPPTAGDKLDWSSEEDLDSYETPNAQKAKKQKRAKAEGYRAKAVSKTNQGDKSSKGRRKEENRHYLYGENKDEGDELLDEEIPEYYKKRKTMFENTFERLKEAGLRLPPKYDGITFSEDDRRDALKEKPVFPRSTPGAADEDVALDRSAGIIPAPIAKWLRSYQVIGVQFLHEHFVYQRGGILGDDMGLGKTIQVISFLTAAFGKTGDERDAKRMRKIRRGGNDRWYPKVIIICPGSLMSNWKEELDRWGWWQVYTYHGSVAEKTATLSAAAKGMAEIIITTYTTYRINKDMLNTIEWDCVIADECHYIKGRQSEVTRAMNDINALCRIGLTGTAIQNNYEELWTLLNWTNPGQFGSLAMWKECISNPLRMGQAHDATLSELSRARRTANKLVKNLLPTFFLRRMKSLIADQLPNKSDRVVFCPLSDTQADAYQKLVNSSFIRYIRMSAEMCDCGSNKKRGWCHYKEIPGFEGKWQHHVFPAIATLQKLANHFALLIPSGNDSHEKQEKDLQTLQIAAPEEWPDLYRQKDSILNFANQEFCGKWKILRRLLEFWCSNGDKVLVFSHSVRLLKMLQMLFATTTSYSISYLDGSLSYEERTLEVNDFNSNPNQFVFLISTRAGGVGLNITSANKVVVVDPNWNPSFDLQAQDRAYRIGQTRDVEVFRLVSAGTIEEIVYARQIYKQQQANIGYNASLERRYFKGVQNETKKKGEIFGLENLFAYQSDQVVLREIVNKTNVAESRAGVLVTGIDIDGEVENDESDVGGVGGALRTIKDEDREDAAMSQLADLIASGGEPKKKRLQGVERKMDGVQWILAKAGVQYTHENSEVIGTSKIESKLSKRAMEHSTDMSTNNARVFAPESQTEAQLRIPKMRAGGRSPGLSYNDDGDESMLDLDDDEFHAVRFQYRPAEDVRKRQFCSMAKHFGYENVTDFAVVVEGWTQEQRRNCLDSFYKVRREEVIFPDISK